MKKSILVVCLCFLFSSVEAIPLEKQIEKLIVNTIEGKYFSPNIVAGDFDSTIIKALGNTYSDEWKNLTEKLFLYELKQFIMPTGIPSVYSVTIYSLNEGIIIHKRKNKINPGKIINTPVDSATRSFLVIVSIGKDYPEEKILLISMRKYKNSFVIEPNACVFGSSSFFMFSGFSYDQETKTINWRKDKKEAFVQYLKGN
jgi:hypothetical protein